METPPPFSPPAPLPPKKGLSGWALAGIGCGGILLVFLIMGIWMIFFGVKKFKEFSSNKELAVAELIIATHPDLEKVSSDPGNGEITVRSKSGEEYTVNYKEITEGRFSFKDGKGNTTHLGGSDNFSEVPAWVPRPPAISGSPSVFHSTTAGKAAGVYHATSTESVDALEKFYSSDLERLGFTSSSNTSTSFNGQMNKSRSYSDGAKREATLALSQDGNSPVSIQMIYKEN